MTIIYFFLFNLFIHLSGSGSDLYGQPDMPDTVFRSNIKEVEMKTIELKSDYLNREVKMDFYRYQTGKCTERTKVLLFNDGQDLRHMNFKNIFQGYCAETECYNLLVVGIIPQDRMNEYGTSVRKDYMGRGAKAKDYQYFITEELIPYINRHYVREGIYSFAGFSLGGLSAFDITWNFPRIFHKVGVFSGSFWWRSNSFSEEFPDANRIVIDYLEKQSSAERNQKYWFQVGEHDETSDRNNNGIIDAIDDTLDVIKALKNAGITDDKIVYVEVKKGTHTIGTWAEIMPEFISWWINDQ